MLLNMYSFFLPPMGVLNNERSLLSKKPSLEMLLDVHRKYDSLNTYYKENYVKKKKKNSDRKRIQYPFVCLLKNLTNK